jgi:hypothetical protein
MPDDGQGQNKTTEPATLAEMIFHYSPNPATRQRLEKFRIEFEALHGPTDLTKRYTSTWPIEQQNWLIRHDPKRYFDGLPPFGKAYIRGKMQMRATKGNLDDTPDGLLRIFIEKAMILDHEERRR